MTTAETPSPPDRHFILGTAGHIDHGKTTLIQALTGTNTDRLPEEQKRGMTIELGFAQLQLDDTTFGIVDVPGHERFVRTMVAGATGVDIALIIVAADDSVMPQTVEHVEILDLLGVRHGVVAITKCDLVDDDLADLVEVDVRDLLARTALKDAPIIRVSSTKKTGLDELRRVLLEAAARVEHEDLDRPFRMPVDRVFTVAGRGTVVTGSVISGRLEAGESVDIWPRGSRAKVRELQSHGRPADSVHAGQRSAINLQGVGREDLERGDELAAVGSIEPTHLVDAQLTCLASHQRPIKQQSRLRLCVGTREIVARCVSLTGRHIEPGESAFVQLRCTGSLTVTHGQRFIVRDENAARTAGGGIVLRAAHRRISYRHTDEIAGLQTLLAGDPRDRVAEVIRSSGFDIPNEQRIALAAGVPRRSVPGLLAELEKKGRIVSLDGTERKVAAAFLAAFDRRSLNWLRNYHKSHPDEPGCFYETMQGRLERRTAKGVGKILMDRLIRSGEVRVMGRYVCLKEFAPSLSAQDEKLLATVLDEFDTGAFQPPSIAELVARTGSNKQRVEKLVKVALSMNQLVQVDGVTYLHARRAEELRQKVRSLFQTQGPFTVSELREALASSRKYVVPIAEYLDRAGVTRRRGDKRELIESDT